MGIFDYPDPGIDESDRYEFRCSCCREDPCECCKECGASPEEACAMTCGINLGPDESDGPCPDCGMYLADGHAHDCPRLMA